MIIKLARDIVVMEKREIEVAGRKVLGVKIELPGAPLVLLVAPKGYIMCGYLNLETAEKLGQAAAVVTGVKNFDGTLEAKISGATTRAKSLGVLEGMSGRKALERMI